MAFDKSAFCCIASGIKNVFMYSTTDGWSTVKASAYFTPNVTNEARYELKNGDLIIACMSTGASLLVVSSTTGASPVTTVSV